MFTLSDNMHLKIVNQPEIKCFNGTIPSPSESSPLDNSKRVNTELAIPILET